MPRFVSVFQVQLFQLPRFSKPPATVKFLGNLLNSWGSLAKRPLFLPGPFLPRRHLPMLLLSVLCKHGLRSPRPAVTFSVDQQSCQVNGLPLDRARLDSATSNDACAIALPFLFSSLCMVSILFPTQHVLDSTQAHLAQNGDPPIRRLPHLQAGPLNVQTFQLVAD